MTESLSHPNRRYVVRPALTPIAAMTPAIARFDGSGMVQVLGVVPMTLTAEAASDLGHRLVEAALGAKAGRDA